MIPTHNEKLHAENEAQGPSGNPHRSQIFCELAQRTRNAHSSSLHTPRTSHEFGSNAIVRLL